MSISIVCSNYNSDKWIDGYLEALNKQIHQEFTVIFVDANSTDNSLSTIKDFKFRDGITVKIIECEDRINIYEAWNLGIENADTEYVMNLNTDDRLYEYGLLTYNRYITMFPEADIFYGPCDIMDNAEHTSNIGVYNWPEYSHQNLLQRCICGPFPLLKKSAVEKAGYFDPIYPYSADYEMWIRMSYLGMNFVRISESVGSYYLNPTGNSTNPENLKTAQAEDKIIQAKYSRAPTKKLSILVCSLKRREHYLKRLMSVLMPQRDRFINEVEIITASDEGETSIGAKRNALIVNSNGEYITFVDDDDVVSEDYVELILNAIKDKPDVVGIHLLHFEDGVHKGLTYHSLKYDHWWDEVNKDNPQLKNYYRNPNHLNPVRKEYAVRTMFPEINMGEDKHYSMGILKYLKTESYIPKPIYTYLFRTRKEC